MGGSALPAWRRSARWLLDRLTPWRVVFMVVFCAGIVCFWPLGLGAGSVFWSAVCAAGLTGGVQEIAEYLDRKTRSVRCKLMLVRGVSWRQRRRHWGCCIRNEYRRGTEPEAAMARPWYTVNQGRKVTGLALITVMGLANAVNIWSEDWSVRWLSGEMAFFGVALVSVASVPVFLTWVVLSFLHGQPRIRATLQVLSRCSGMGTAAGFVVAIAAGFRLMGGQPADSSSIVTLLVQGLSIGAVVGFSFGLFIVVIDTAKRFKNRYVASAVAVATLFAASAVTTQIADPRHVWTRFLRQLTAGVPPADIDRLQRELDRLQTAEAKRAFAESIDWRAVLAGYQGQVSNGFPSPWQFTVAMTIIITIVTAFSLIHWLRTRRTAPRYPFPDLSGAFEC